MRQLPGDANYITRGGLTIDAALLALQYRTKMKAQPKMKAQYKMKAQHKMKAQSKTKLKAQYSQVVIVLGLIEVLNSTQTSQLPYHSIISLVGFVAALVPDPSCIAWIEVHDVPALSRVQRQYLRRFNLALHQLSVGFPTCTFTGFCRDDIHLTRASERLLLALVTDLINPSSYLSQPAHPSSVSQMVHPNSVAQLVHPNSVSQMAHPSSASQMAHPSSVVSANIDDRNVLGSMIQDEITTVVRLLRQRAACGPTHDAHPGSDLFQMAHPGSDSYRTDSVPLFMAHPGSDSFQMAHPGSDSSQTDSAPFLLAHPGSDSFQMAHPGSESVYQNELHVSVSENTVPFEPASCGSIEPIGFWKPVGQFGYLSNFHLEPVFDPESEITFNSGEQMYQYKKCLFHNQHDQAELVLLEPRPHFQKRAASTFASLPTWHDDAKTWIMHATLVCKFESSCELRDRLRGTGTRPLFELSPYDKCWGTGVAVHSTSFPGENRLGRLLETVRAEL
jgi:ribA/ribD-fused uncharacterized protein